MSTKQQQTTQSKFSCSCFSFKSLGDFNVYKLDTNPADYNNAIEESRYSKLNCHHESIEPKSFDVEKK